jgi:hypothetical protein
MRLTARCLVALLAALALIVGVTPAAMAAAPSNATIATSVAVTKLPTTDSHPTGVVQPPVGLNRRVSGSVTASGFFEFSSRGCSFVYQQLDGTYDTKQGPGSFHVAGCVNLASGFVFLGTFTITTPQGDTITGTAEGPVFPLELTLTVTDTRGSPSLKNVGGTILLTLDGISGSLHGTLSGSLNHHPG